jgi:hypothetical protein
MDTKSRKNEIETIAKTRGAEQAREAMKRARRYRVRVQIGPSEYDWLYCSITKSETIKLINEAARKNFAIRCNLVRFHDWQGKKSPLTLYIEGCE